jgi:chromosome segregation ATPase
VAQLQRENNDLAWRIKESQAAGAGAGGGGSSSSNEKLRDAEDLRVALEEDRTQVIQQLEQAKAELDATKLELTSQQQENQRINATQGQSTTLNDPNDPNGSNGANSTADSVLELEVAQLREQLARAQTAAQNVNQLEADRLQEAQDTQAKMQQLEIICSQASETTQSKQKELDMERERVLQLEREIEQIRREKHEAFLGKEPGEEHTAAVTELEGKLETAQHSISEQQVKLKLAEEECIRSKEQIGALEQAKHESEAALETSSAALSMMTDQLAELNGKIEESETDLGRWKDRAELHEKSFREVQSTHEASTRELVEARTGLLSAEGEVEGLQQELAHLRAANQTEIEAKLEALSRLATAQQTATAAGAVPGDQPSEQADSAATQVLGAKLQLAEKAAKEWQTKAEQQEQSRADELSKAMLKRDSSLEQIEDLEAALAASQQLCKQELEAKAATEALVAEQAKKVTDMEEELAILFQSTAEGQQKQQELAQTARGAAADLQSALVASQTELKAVQIDMESRTEVLAQTQNSVKQLQSRLAEAEERVVDQEGDLLDAHGQACASKNKLEALSAAMEKDQAAKNEEHAGAIFDLKATAAAASAVEVALEKDVLELKLEVEALHENGAAKEVLLEQLQSQTQASEKDEATASQIKELQTQLEQSDVKVKELEQELDKRKARAEEEAKAHETRETAHSAELQKVQEVANQAAEDGSSVESSVKDALKTKEEQHAVQLAEKAKEVESELESVQAAHEAKLREMMEQATLLEEENTLLLKSKTEISEELQAQQKEHAQVLKVKGQELESAFASLEGEMEAKQAGHTTMMEAKELELESALETKEAERESMVIEKQEQMTGIMGKASALMEKHKVLQREAEQLTEAREKVMQDMELQGADSQAAIAELEGKLQSAQKEATKWKEAAAAHAAELEVLESLRGSETVVLTELRNSLSQSEADFTELEGRLVETEAGLCSWKELAESRQAQLQSAEESRNRLEEQLAVTTETQTNDIRRAEERATEAQQETDATAAEAQALMDQLRDLQEAHVAKMKLQQQLEELQVAKDDEQAALAAMTSSLSVAEEQLAGLEAHLQDRDDDVELWKEKSELHSMELEELQELQQKHAAELVELQQLQEKAREGDCAMILQLNANLAFAETNFAEIEGQMLQHAADNEGLRSEVDSYAHQVEQLQEASGSAREKLEVVVQLNERVAELEQSLREAEETRDHEKTAKDAATEEEEARVAERDEQTRKQYAAAEARLVELEKQVVAANALAADWKAKVDAEVDTKEQPAEPAEADSADAEATEDNGTVIAELEGKIESAQQEATKWKEAAATHAAELVVLESSRARQLEALESLREGDAVVLTELRNSLSQSEAGFTELEGRLVETEADLCGTEAELAEVEGKLIEAEALGSMGEVAAAGQSVVDAALVTELEGKIESAQQEATKWKEAAATHAAELEAAKSTSRHAANSSAAAVRMLRRSLNESEADAAELEGKLIHTEGHERMSAETALAEVSVELERARIDANKWKETAASHAGELKVLQEASTGDGAMLSTLRKGLGESEAQFAALEGALILKEAELEEWAVHERAQQQLHSVKAQTSSADLAEMESKLIRNEAELEDKLQEEQQRSTAWEQKAATTAADLEVLQQELRAKQIELERLVGLSHSVTQLETGQNEATERLQRLEESASRLAARLSEELEQRQLMIQQHAAMKAAQEKELQNAQANRLALEKELFGAQEQLRDAESHIVNYEGRLIATEGQASELSALRQKQEAEIAELRRTVEEKAAVLMGVKMQLMESEETVLELEARLIETDGEVCRWKGRAEMHCAHVEAINNERKVELQNSAELEVELCANQARVVELEAQLIEKEGELGAWMEQVRVERATAVNAHEEMWASLNTARDQITQLRQSLVQAQANAEWQASQSQAQHEYMQQESNTLASSLADVRAKLGEAEAKLELLQVLMERVYELEQHYERQAGNLGKLETAADVLQVQKKALEGDLQKKERVLQTTTAKLEEEIEAKKAMETHTGDLEEIVDEYQQLLDEERETARTAQSGFGDKEKLYQAELARIQQLGALGARGTEQLKQQQQALYGQLELLTSQLTEEQDHTKELQGLLEETEEDAEDMDVLEKELEDLKYENMQLRGGGGRTGVFESFESPDPQVLQRMQQEMSLSDETQEAMDEFQSMAAGLDVDLDSMTDYDKDQLWKQLEHGISTLKQDLALATQEVANLAK